MKRLYEVQGAIIVYVLAEDRSEAESIASSDAARNEPENIKWNATKVPKGATLAWGPGVLVYGAEDETTLGDAVKKYVEDR